MIALLFLILSHSGLIAGYAQLIFCSCNYHRSRAINFLLVQLSQISRNSLSARAIITESHTINSPLGQLPPNLTQFPQSRTPQNRKRQRTSRCLSPFTSERSYFSTTRGSNASRNPSPIKLKHNTVIKISKPGNVGYHHALRKIVIL